MTVTPIDCPFCNTPLGLFTPRERNLHVESCLPPSTSQPIPEPTPPPREKRACVICSKDLTNLTENAALAHANRCVDALGGGTSVRIRGRPRNGRRNEEGGLLGEMERRRREVAVVKGCDERVDNLLEKLGLGRYIGVFGKEEVDWEALKIMSEVDLKSLNIPESARRRVAEAVRALYVMENVEDVQLGEVQGGLGNEEGDGEMGEDRSVVGDTGLQESRLGQTMKRRGNVLWKSIEQATQFDMDNPGEPTQKALPHRNKYGGCLDDQCEDRSAEVVDLISPIKCQNGVHATDRDVQGPGVTQLEEILEEAQNDGILSDHDSHREDTEITVQQRLDVKDSAAEENGRACAHEEDGKEAAVKYSRDVEKMKNLMEDGTDDSDSESEIGLRLYNEDPVRPKFSLSAALSQTQGSPIVIKSSPEENEASKNQSKAPDAENARNSNIQAVISKRSESHKRKRELRKRRRNEIVDEYNMQVELENQRHSAHLETLLREMNKRLAECKEEHDTSEDEANQRRISSAQNNNAQDQNTNEVTDSSVHETELFCSQDVEELDELSTCSLDSILRGESESVDFTQREFQEELENSTSNINDEQSTQTNKLPLADTKIVLQCIRNSEELYDSILAMETVTFEQVMGSITHGGYRVPKSRLVRLLDSEGISYKPPDSDGLFFGRPRKKPGPRPSRLKKGSRVKRGAKKSQR